MLLEDWERDYMKDSIYLDLEELKNIENDFNREVSGVNE